jgi:glycosyltransferase involved in cell wall biosynthesis
MERWGDAAIAIDRDVAARFPLRLPLTIVHNSVRPPSSSPNGSLAKRTLGLPEDRVAIGLAGFVRRQKGWRELVSAARILVEQGAPAHFVIMGGGVRPPEYFRTVRGRALAAANLLTDEESASKELVATKGLDRNFSFLPFTAETGEIYSALDIVTFPNQGIGLGRPVLEAATYAKPVVASGSDNGAGILLPGRTGFLLDDERPEHIADALEAVVRDRERSRAMGAAARRRVEAEFTPERYVSDVEQIYQTLL